MPHPAYSYRPPLLESEGFPPKIFGGKKNLISATWRKFPPIDVATDFNFGVTAVTDYFSNFIFITNLSCQSHALFDCHVNC